MFDAVLMVDWSAGNDRGAKPCADAIWMCLASDGIAQDPVYLRNRQQAEVAITDVLKDHLARGKRLLVGFDLCFAYPKGFAHGLTGSTDPLALWGWFADRVEDTPKRNNRFELAGQINRCFPGVGPFWFNGLKTDIADLPRKGLARDGHGLPEKRATDGTGFSPWQLGGAGAVGGQVIMGLPTLHRLRRRFGAALSVWPFEAPDTPLVLAETYFSLVPDALNRAAHPIKDAAQTAFYAAAFSGLEPQAWRTMLDHPPHEEGWVLGFGHETLLRAKPDAVPVLKNDCFALPQGVHWTPVSDALAHLKTHLTPVTRQGPLEVGKALGRFMSAAAHAVRSHPPVPNTAVDGYAFAGPLPDGLQTLTLIDGRAAPGASFGGAVRPKEALRVLTGASLPAGTDTVVLQEDVQVADGFVHVNGPLKAGANARAAGEDIAAGQPLLMQGRRLRAADLATLSAAGIGQVQVHDRLRVGVLSTGDELTDPGPARDDQIYDANRPMLLADVKSWGFDAIDLGRAPDKRDHVATILTDAASRCDVIITSGGASGGDEDHMSQLLTTAGSFALWRIAIKPGRPLVFGLWEGVPVFGLPGNPVAAQVCALIFAYPALHRLAGGAWVAPQTFHVPAAFSKSKKPGRREYLRARLDSDGRAEVFASEGSGRVSGLSWATGLVELPDAAVTVRPGDPVAYLPFSGFGL